MKWHAAFAWTVALALAGCAASPLPRTADDARAMDAVPVLRLAPSSLGREMAVQQQLAVTVKGQTHRIDVLLEADASAVRLALVSMGQTAARLEWDGMRLTETRSPWLPAVVSGERILSDLQLALWPEAAVRAALPAGWFLDTTASGRVLRQHTSAVATVAFPSPSRIELDQLRDGYHLVIDTRSVP